MAVTLQRLPEEPILVAHYSGSVTTDDVLWMYAETDRLIGADETCVFRIIHVGDDVESDFLRVLDIARTVGQHLPGSAFDPRIVGILVGTDRWAKLLAELLHLPQYGGLNFPFFRDMASAFEYVDVQMKKRRLSA